MVDFDVGWIWGGLLKKSEREMTKSTIYGQNPQKGTGTHCVEGMWYRYQKFGYRYPLTVKDWYRYLSKWYRYRCSQQPYICIPCTIKSRVYTSIVKEP